MKVVHTIYIYTLASIAPSVEQFGVYSWLEKLESCVSIDNDQGSLYENGSFTKKTHERASYKLTSKHFTLSS